MTLSSIEYRSRINTSLLWLTNISEGDKISGGNKRRIGTFDIGPSSNVSKEPIAHPSPSWHLLPMTLSPSVVELNCLCVMASRRRHTHGKSMSSVTSSTRWHEVCVSLQSYTYLLRRIHLVPTEHVATEGGYVPISSADTGTLVDYRTQQVHDLFSVLQVFVLPQECMQCTLERRLANPYSDFDNSTIPLL